MRKEESSKVRERKRERKRESKRERLKEKGGDIGLKWIGGIGS